ncbi:hypothetical protein A2U01_0004568, partial [Trifolium medium]|nr:hypothetical protein [Trifolium medium]
MIANISSTAIISVDFNSKLIITRQGTRVSPTAPILRDLWFHKLKWSTYIVELQADDDLVFVSIPENVTHDIAGNKNLASNVLQVRHYSVPLSSCVISAFATATFALTSIAAGLLTISTASLQSVDTFARSSSFLIVDPVRNLFRILCHIQVFALARWLSAKLPVEFYEFSRHLQWTIPYFSVPWESGPMSLFMVGSSPFGSSNSFTKTSATIPNMLLLGQNLNYGASVYGSPLTSSEYRRYFESENMKPEAEYILDSQHSSGKRNSEKPGIYGALVFPRFEIFLLFLALPGICKASSGLIK